MARGGWIGSAAGGWAGRLGGVLLAAALALAPGGARAASVSADALMDWAERTYAELFPGPRPTLTWQDYRYRHYPQTGNYLGVAGEAVYVLGPVAGDAAAPLRVGSVADYACRVEPALCATAVPRPLGLFASAPRNGIYAHPQLHGVLVRVAWSAIEPQPGVFDFGPLETVLAPVRAAGVPWSLAVGAGGPGTPAWLMDGLGAPSLAYNFRGTTPLRLPLWWHDTVQQRLAALAARLGQAYAGEAQLKLVYVSQMTANGLEGHLNGIDMVALRGQGYTDDRWVAAALGTTRAFAQAFAARPLAFEVHEIDRRADVPRRILEGLAADTALAGRVGAAMWWLSGRTDYQPALLEVLAGWQGDLYGQVIARSDESAQFAGGDYASVFAQAKSLRMRYLEAWEYDFGSGSNTANGRWDALLKDFNDWAAGAFPARAALSAR